MSQPREKGDDMGDEPRRVNVRVEPTEPEPVHYVVKTEPIAEPEPVHYVFKGEPIAAPERVHYVVTNSESERLLKPEEVAERLGVSPITAKAWLRTGKLPVVKVGERGLLRMREADLNRYIRGLAADQGREV